MSHKNAKEERRRQRLRQEIDVALSEYVKPDPQLRKRILFELIPIGTIGALFQLIYRAPLLGTLLIAIAAGTIVWEVRRYTLRLRWVGKHRIRHNRRIIWIANTAAVVLINLGLLGSAFFGKYVLIENSIGSEK